LVQCATAPSTFPAQMWQMDAAWLIPAEARREARESTQGCQSSCEEGGRGAG